MRFKEASDILDDSDLRKEASKYSEYFKKKMEGIKHYQQIDNSVVIDLDFNLQMEKIIGISNYLNEKGFIPDKLRKSSSESF